MNLHVYSPTSSRPTVCVTGAGAGVDSVWEQYKLEVTLREMLENAARRPYGWQSAASSARFVGRSLGKTLLHFFLVPTSTG